MRSILVPIFCLFLCISASDWTVFKFSRKTNTCDNNDRVIQNSTTKLVWSYSSQIPSNDNTIYQHEKRGSKSIRFFETATTSTLPSNVQTLDVRFNNSNITFQTQIHGPTTNYWCSGFRIPPFAAKQHIVRMDPIIDPRNTPHVHHILIYLCETLNSTDLAYNGPCYEGAPQSIEECNGRQAYAAWAVGGLSFVLPDHLGLPLGPAETYMMMEVHYDNPTAVPSFVDSSGIRYTYTSTLRANEAGLMGMGHITNDLFTIPPQQQAYTLDGWCASDCTNSSWFPSSGIKIAAGLLHTHIAGRSIELNHYRGNTELPPVMEEPSYDFNYQDFIFLDREREVLPGDSLQIRCTYNTMDRTQPTKLALSTRDEMCLSFLLYYPRVTEEFCQYANIPDLGPTAFCGNTMMNATLPTNVTEYVPPACQNNPPMANQTVAQLADKPLNFSSYQHNTTLDDEGKYKLYWTVDRENWVVHGAVAVETKGWVGLGVSGMGGMVGSDVFIGWVKDGEVHFADRMAQAQTLPPRDTQQDYYDVAAYQKNDDMDNAAERTVVFPLSIIALAAFSLLHANS